MSLLDVATQWLTSEQWRFDVEDGTLRVPFRGKSGAWVCIAEERPGEVFVFTSVLGERVDDARRAAVAEYITRVNAALTTGNFELDWERGVLRFRTSVDVEGTTLTAALVKNACLANVASVDRFRPGLFAVLAGADAADAARRALA